MFGVMAVNVVNEFRVSMFQQFIWTKSGEGFSWWETTPFGVSLALPYANAFRQRVQNGGCYLGKKCR